MNQKRILYLSFGENAHFKTEKLEKGEAKNKEREAKNER